MTFGLMIKRLLRWSYLLFIWFSVFFILLITAPPFLPKAATTTEMLLWAICLLLFVSFVRRADKDTTD